MIGSVGGVIKVITAKAHADDIGTVFFRFVQAGDNLGGVEGAHTVVAVGFHYHQRAFGRRADAADRIITAHGDGTAAVRAVTVGIHRGIVDVNIFAAVGIVAALPLRTDPEVIHNILVRRIAAGVYHCHLHTV